ncbi:MAG: type IV pilus assembly protein PilM [Candidatus Doudnabacteria bacterium]|nr:type IV pilus assembly protein PilM [Candidatus Doudnabacteria bacterium]
MLFGKTKSHLGVDIGTSNIKIVQLKPQDDKFILETYGLVNAAYQISNKDSPLAINKTAEIIKNLLNKAGTTTDRIVASLPNSVVFTSVMELPKIPENEVQAAVEFEAKKYVPLPLSEVAISWSVLTDSGSLSQDGKNRVLLTAVPHSVIDNYLKVFSQAGLAPEALEIEALALIRSLVGEGAKNIILIDIGAKNTSLNLVESGYLRLSKNLTVGGDTVTSSIAQSLNINFARAEQFKKDFGLSNTAQQIPQIMRPILDIIKSEAMQLISIFESHSARLDKILLSGGGAKLPGLLEYFSVLGKPVVLAKPWSRVVYPPELKPVIEPLGLNLALAAGLAMRK